jgi:hypothetical protein
MKRFDFAAVPNGYCPKLIGIKAFDRRVTPNELSRLINECVVAVTSVISLIQADSLA